MKKSLPVEFIYQIFSLFIVFIVVHAFYVVVIRPNAYDFIEQQYQIQKADPSHQTDNPYYVVIKDYEQETCIILMFWALSILAFKGIASYRQQKLLDQEVFGLPEDLPIGIEDTRQLVEKIRQMPLFEQQSLLCRSLLGAIERFRATHNVQDVATNARDIIGSEGDRLDTELSIIRYISWAIPSIGFIGTVRGIGDALGQAHLAVEGDITGVTENLAVAFNSTFIALVISIILMFFVHQLQLMQERLVLDTERYVDHWLIRRLRGQVSI